MPTLNIEGRRVKVDDSFLQMSPDEQHAQVDAIAKQLKIAPPSSGESPGMVEGVGRAAARGVPIIGGLLNKADAATNAALAPVLNPLFDDKDQLKEPTFRERYQHSLRDQEGTDNAFAEQHPIADAVAEIAGGVASTGAAASTATGAKLLGLTGKTLPQMIKRGAASGAAIGGVDAAVRGQDDPVTAGGVGAVVGGASPAVGRLVNAKIATPIRDLWRGFRDPATEASRRVAGAINADVRSGNRGLSLKELVDEAADGTPVNLMDTGGETTRALARSAANTSEEGRDELNRVINKRFETQSPRLAEWMRHTFHFPNADAQQDALDKVARTVNRPNYAKAYSEGSNLKFDESLEQISQAPVVQDAIRKAMVSAKNDAAKLGFTPPKNPFQFDESGRLKLKANDDGSKMEPNLQFWDSRSGNCGSKAAQGTPRESTGLRIGNQGLSARSVE
jgi:hypothetical protein